MLVPQGRINAYNPSLSGAWMLQRAMSVRPGQGGDPQFINKLLGANFAVMQKLGDATLRPFLQVVVVCVHGHASCGSTPSDDEHRDLNAIYITVHRT